jgi:hypothetical protein
VRKEMRQHDTEVHGAGEIGVSGVRLQKGWMDGRAATKIEQLWGASHSRTGVSGFACTVVNVMFFEYWNSSKLCIPDSHS